ncbi:MAG: alpha/beta hydrolase [Rubrivivax sp.]|nr:alpha/beta hydrolase [Rubrivivax sp.]
MHPVYLLPGWQDSGPGHWQSLWEQQHGDTRVVQDDWLWPRRGDWMARLDEVLLADARLLQNPALLAAHSLGCLLVAAWAAHSRHTARVAGALLVAPPDTEREDFPLQLAGWRPIPRGPLPFASVAVLSSDDPYGEAGRMRGIAGGWGSRVIDTGPKGHLNAESGLGDWPAARTWLKALA